MLIGIDLGTTNSLGAYFDGTGAKIIPNRLGSHLTPSVVSVDEEGTVYVGETAKERKLLYPFETAEVFKRSMGTDKEYKLGKHTFRAEELSSFVLRSLKEDAEAFLGEKVEEAIVSVPAYFNDLQRKATKRAGELAGLKVDRIINEPTAAAIAHGISMKNAKTRFLVFDLGGGTFDVSVLELYKSIMEVRAIAGDNYIGGEDFTEVLMQWFMEQCGKTLSSLDYKTLARLKKEAERCKLSFSDVREAGMHMKFDEEEFTYKLTLDAYEELCQPLFDKMRKPIERSLRDAGLKLADVNEIVLVGGATKLPLIRKFVGKLFRRLPQTDLNPDEAIAIGAALQCGMKQRDEAIKEIVLTDVCPFTLGTEVVAERFGMYREGGHYMPIIERNTVIPVSRTHTLYTATDYQSKLRVKVLQGESRMAKNNVYLGEIIVPVPPRKEGEESVDVTYTYDKNSLLEVVVKVNSTGEKKKIIIQRDDTDMTQEQIEKRFEELQYLKIHPRDLEENRLALLRAERMYEEASGYDRVLIDEAIAKFEQVLDKQERIKIDDARQELKETLDELEKFERF